DTVIVWIETHFLVFDREGQIVGADAAGGLPPRPVISARDVADCLGELATYGCRVLVLLDGVHEYKNAPKGWDSRIDEWARDLYRRNVIAFLASVQGPSRRLPPEGHGAFALAVLKSRDVRSQTRLMARPSDPATLDEFRDVVEQSVPRLTGLQQIARCYIPGTIHPRTAIFEPPNPSRDAPRLGQHEPSRPLQGPASTSEASRGTSTSGNETSMP
ncbi:MAG: hypothetical protein IRY99_23995, partial [Isosphaeraceae bacterium]|nr:hypothetical protein [Isosphaeraceae bacterium]